MAPVRGPAAGAEVRLDGRGDGGVTVHAADGSSGRRLCDPAAEPLLPTFAAWSAPVPVWARRCPNCLEASPVDGPDARSPSRPIVAGGIWRWTGTVGDEMTVTGTGIAFVSFPHLYLRRRFLPWEGIEGFVAGHAGSALGGGRLWFPELVPSGGPHRRQIWIPGLLLPTEDDARRAATLVNAALRLG